MKRETLIFVLVFVFIKAFWCSGCTETDVPALYKQGVLKLKTEMEELDKIPFEERPITNHKQNGIHTGILDYRKRAEYLANNKKAWDEILSLFNEAIKIRKLRYWMDDALFCRALAYLTVASVDKSIVPEDDVLASITEFIEFNQHSNIEKWTKRQLTAVFWDKMDKLFSDSLSEKKNLNAFFHIGKGSLLQHKQGNARRALEEYEKALMLDPHGFFGQQARGQIELLKKNEPGVAH
jgi:tetratricopeptide (TPR) repeat protein